MMLEVTVQHTKSGEKRLQAHQEMIIEMSAAVILLTKDAGLLALVGEIDTYPAQIICGNVLKQSYDLKLESLFIAILGLPIVDTMVAHQIFQSIEGLKIIGVKSQLFGIFLEIAQTSIQLSINFGEIKVSDTFAQAMKGNSLKLQQT